MKIPWRAANEGPPVPEEQYQERFWRRRLDGIGLDTSGVYLATTECFLAIEFKRTRDARSNNVERAPAVAQEQYKSLLTGLQAVGQVKGWKVQQIVFVGGTCGSIHVESFNRNMKTLGILVKALFASCPVSLSHKSLYSKLIATLDRTTTNIDGTP